MSALPASIPFQNIPQSNRVPLFFAEVNNSQANTNQQNQRTLIMGQILASGAATPNMPLISQGPSDAVIQGGPGSMLALMTKAYFNSDDSGEVWYLPLSDAEGSIAATGTITIAGAPTAAGVISLYIGGVLTSIAVATTDTPTTIAVNIASAINANTNLPVAAAAALGVVTVTANNKGLGGNDIDLRVNYGGAAASQSTPAGITVAIVAMSNGATNPTLTTALANLGDQPFDFIVCPYNDSISIDALVSLLNDQTGRWSWASQVFGHAFAAARGTYSALTTLGTAQNFQHISILGFYDSPSPNWIWVADYVGAAAVSLREDPGVPLQTLTLSTVLAPPTPSQFILTERNNLLYDGISTFTVNQGNVVALENIITTYQKNSFGQPDDSYLEVETMFLLMYVVRDMASLVTSKYARCKLAADGTPVTPGSNVVTPSVIKADIIAEYYKLQSQGYVQNAAAFAQNIIVQQNANNPNRVDFLWPGTLIDQLRELCMLAQFRLQ